MMMILARMLARRRGDDDSHDDDDSFLLVVLVLLLATIVVAPLARYVERIGTSVVVVVWTTMKYDDDTQSSHTNPKPGE